MDIQKELRKAQEKKKELIKNELKKEVECGEKLDAMRGSPGWKLVEEYINYEMEAATTALLTSGTERDIYYNQAVVTVYRKLLEKIGISFQLAINAGEMLKKYK